MRSDCPDCVSFASVLSLFSKLGRPVGRSYRSSYSNSFQSSFGGRCWEGGEILLPIFNDENIYDTFLPELLLKAPPFSPSLSRAPSDIPFSFELY